MIKNSVNSKHKRPVMLPFIWTDMDVITQQAINQIWFCIKDYSEFLYCYQ
jgi:hypothetical protein